MSVGVTGRLQTKRFEFIESNEAKAIPYKRFMRILQKKSSIFLSFFFPFFLRGKQANFEMAGGQQNFASSIDD